MRTALLDAGPLVALFAADDQYHGRFDALLKSLSRQGLRLITTWPCVVEAAYLLEAPHRFHMLRWVELGGAQVYSFSPADLPDMVSPMRQYTERGKREMDFADASLYWVAVQTGIREILTVDIADFARYRLPDGKSFEVL